MSGLTAKLIWDRRGQSTLPRPQGVDFYFLLPRVVAATSRRRRMQREENPARGECQPRGECSEQISKVVAHDIKYLNTCLASQRIVF